MAISITCVFSRTYKGGMAMIKVTRLPNSLTGFFTPLKDFFSPAQWEHFRFLILAFCVISGRRTIRNLRNGLSDRHSHRTNLHDFVIQAVWDPVAVIQEATLGLLKRLKPQENERCQGSHFPRADQALVIKLFPGGMT